MFLYLAQGSRPDLSFAVNYLACFALCPDGTHWMALNRLIHYLRRTKDLQLRLLPANEDECPLKTYVDASWGGEGARSIHGFITTLWNSPIAWGAKRQQCVARSTCQAEYIALSYAAVETLSLRNLLHKFLPGIQPRLLSDNQAATKIATDRLSMKRTRHIDREFHYINELLRKNELDLCRIKGTEQLGDIFTKALGPVKQREFLNRFF